MSFMNNALRADAERKERWLVFYRHDTRNASIYDLHLHTRLPGVISNLSHDADREGTRYQLGARKGG